MKILKFLQTVAVTLAVSNWYLAPIAQASVSSRDKESISQFLKFANLSGKESTTFGEFYEKFRPAIPADIVDKMDTWAFYFKDEKVPKVDMQVVKDSEGIEQLRLRFLFKKQPVSIVLNDEYVQINSTKFKIENFKNGEEFLERWEKEDPKLFANAEKGKELKPEDARLFPNEREWNALNDYQKGIYRIKIRLALEAAEKVMLLDQESGQTGAMNFDSGNSGASNSYFGGRTDLVVLYRWIAGMEAFAKPQEGDPCVVAGFVTTYGPNGKSCGGSKKDGVLLNEDLKTQLTKLNVKCSSGFPCNPQVYGFNTSGGAHCISNGQLQEATRHCGSKAPIDTPEQQKKILDSWLAKANKSARTVYDENGKLKIHGEDFSKYRLDIYFAKLEEYIDNAVGICRLKNQEGKLLKDQPPACDELEKRKFILQDFMPKAPDCRNGELIEVEEPAGSGRKKMKCHVNPPKQEPEQTQPKSDPDFRGNNDQYKERGKQRDKPAGASWFSRNSGLLIGGALLVGVGVFAWWLTRDKKRNPPTYVPPVCGHPYCGPINPPPPPVPPPVLPPVTPGVEGGSNNPPPVQGGGVNTGR